MEIFWKTARVCGVRAGIEDVSWISSRSIPSGISYIRSCNNPCKEVGKLDCFVAELKVGIGFGEI